LGHATSRNFGFGPRFALVGFAILSSFPGEDSKKEDFYQYITGSLPNFAHLKNPAVIGDSMHVHAYRMEKQPDKSFKLVMQSRLSTDAEGIGTCLGLQAEARVELEQIVQALQAKLSPTTLFVPV